MASMKIVGSLQQVAIFRDLEPGQLDALSRHTERIKFAAGDLITRAGQAGDGAYLVVSGTVERLPEPPLLEGPEVVPPGSLIGQLAMLIEHVYGSSIVARDRACCLKITRAGMHAQMVSDPALAQHFERHVTQHLRAVARQLNEIDSLLQARRHGLAGPVLVPAVPPPLTPPKAIAPPTPQLPLPPKAAGRP